MASISIHRRAFLGRAARTALAAPILSSAKHLIAAGSTPDIAPAPAQSVKPSLTLNVRDFGATGDGVTKDTAAIQRAIDRCAVLGGGEVFVPAGNYLTGAIVLRSYTLLCLDKNAVLQGSPDFADYPVTQVR